MKNLSDLHQFGLRIPEELKARLKESAKNNHLSLNSELVERLAKSFDRPLQQHSDGDLVAELMARYGHGEIYIRIGRPAEENGASSAPTAPEL
jgi:hypothetical protein